jgi:hypothetical protein
MLLSGNVADGNVLSGQPQGVRPGGSGITIGTDGIISVNSQTIQGVMKLGQTPAAALAAYNQYDWPTTAPLPGQQLTAVTVAGITTLGWSDADGIPWTQKGQLIVGAGVATDALLNAGTNTSFLVANTGSTSGLTYTDTLTSAVLLPVGNNTTDRPVTASVGQIRYNSTDNVFEGYSGSPASWQSIGGDMPTGAGGDKIFYLNSQNVTANYTLPSAPLAKNSVSAGPITIAASVTVTVPAGQSWSIV